MKMSDIASQKGIQNSAISGNIYIDTCWDAQALILEHYRKRETTVNNVLYSEMISDQLKPVIRTKRRRLLLKGVVMLHENARPHNAAHTVENLHQLKFEVLKHLKHSHHLASCDYLLFGPIKDAFRDRNFAGDQEVKGAVHMWFTIQFFSFFSECTKKIVDRWTSVLIRTANI
jgi:hypothetical protein